MSHILAGVVITFVITFSMVRTETGLYSDVIIRVLHGQEVTTATTDLSL